MSQKIAVIGAGPGGLAAACLLRAQGHEVDLFEAHDTPGGRNARVSLDGGYHFDLGPTFYLMPELLDQIFSVCGRTRDDYIKLYRIDPLYQLSFADGSTLTPMVDPFETARRISKFSKKDADSFWFFRERQTAKFHAILPALKKAFTSYADLADPALLPALKYLNFSTVYDEISKFFEDERVRLSLTFQAKYLGMSPTDCPSLFTILPQIEHGFGIWHPEGGCNQVSSALAKLFVDIGGTLHYSSPVEKVVTQGKIVKSLTLADGREVSVDFAVMNADFAYGMSRLFDNEARKKYTDKKLEKLKYSCSTFMLYLGIEGELDWPHHGIYFSQNYHRFLRDLSESQRIHDDISFYLHNPIVTDDTMAPKGHSALYVLVPVPNLDAEIDWNSFKHEFRNQVLDKIAQRTGVDLRPRIRAEKIVSPLDWRDEFRVYKGATFNLAHSFDQLLHLRPQNRSEEFSNLYLVGGGTHPGSGLPTILQSAMIASDLISNLSKKGAVYEKVQKSFGPWVGSWRSRFGLGATEQGISGHHS